MSYIDNRGRSIYVGSLANEVTEELLWEIFLQVGPIEDVVIVESKLVDSGPENLSRDRRYAFIVYEHEESGLFACKVMSDVSFFGQKITVKPRRDTENDRIWRSMRYSGESKSVFKREINVERYTARSTSETRILTPSRYSLLLTPPPRPPLLPSPPGFPVLVPSRPLSAMTPTNHFQQLSRMPSLPLLPLSNSLPTLSNSLIPSSSWSSLFYFNDSATLRSFKEPEHLSLSRVPNRRSIGLDQSRSYPRKKHYGQC